MAWKIKWDQKAAKGFRKISRPDQIKIQKYLTTKISTLDNPKEFGNPLGGNLSGLWRYRVADYRIVCNFQEDVMTIFVLAVGHRSKVYE